MKKNKIKIYITIIFFLSALSQTKALYNGTGGTVYTGSGSYSCTGNNKYCSTGNQSGIIIIKAGIYYIDNGNFTNENNPIGGDYYFVNSKGESALSGANVKIKKIKEFDDCTENNRYLCASEKLRKYFGDVEGNPKPTSEGENFLNEATGQTGKEGYLKVLTKESQFASKTNAATKGYRIIIEPIRFYSNSLVRKSNGTIVGGGIVFLTPKELAGVTISFGRDQGNGKYAYGKYYIPSCTGTAGKNVSGCKNPLIGNGSFAQYLFIEFDDVGISKYKNGCTNVSVAELASLKNGCGFNIIDISSYAKPPKCYDATSSMTSGSLKCEHENLNNVGILTEKYTERTCTTEESEKNTNSKYGKSISDNENCTLYCIESSEVSLPGNVTKIYDISKPGNKGLYFAWPGVSGKTETIMEMYMNTKMKCTIVQKKDKKCDSNDIEKLKKKALDVVSEKTHSAKLTGGTNKKIVGSELVVYKKDITNFNKIGNVELNNDGVSNSFEVSKKSKFKINDEINRFYNHATGEVINRKINTDMNLFVDRGAGVISFGSNDDTKTKYELEISEIDTGNVEFNNIIKQEKYVCYYQITNSSCVCPEGTVRAGEPLYEKLTKGKTCAELQVTECNKCKCDDNSDYPGKIVLEGEEATKEACDEIKYSDKCYKTTCTYVVNGEKKEIPTSQCISEQKKAGLTEGEAIIYCREKLCPVCVDKNGDLQDLQECMDAGNTYSMCKYLKCPNSLCPNGICNSCSKNCTWKLTKKSKTSIEYSKSCSDGKDCGYIKLSCPGGNNKMNNAEDCVKKQLNSKIKGNTISAALTSGLITNNDVQTAFNACRSEVCPYSGSKIIYRQIDLNDPFPGKEHKGTNTNDALKLSNNNQSIRTRTPGYNWNSKTVIESKILNARGAKGYELYNKDPLYIIKLTPSTMKKIRAYNKNNSYNDFNLKCTNKNQSAACISRFLHENTVNNLNVKDFIVSSYDGKNSVNTCNNMNYNEGSFKSCYESNN